MGEDGNQVNVGEVGQGVTSDVATGDSGTTPVSTETMNLNPDEASVSRDDFKGLSKFIKRDTENNSADGTATATTPTADSPSEVTVATEKAEPPVPATDGPTDGDGTAVKPEDTNQDPVETISSAELAELRKGAMLHADYTRKTQELAEERRKFQQDLEHAQGLKDSPVTEALDLWNSLSMDPIGTIRFLEQHYNEKGFNEPKDPEVLKIEQALAEEQKRNKELADQLQSKDVTESQAKFDQYMADLAMKYKDDGFDTTEVINFCIETGINNPEMAFKIMQHDKLVSKNKELEGQLKDSSKTAVTEYVKEKVTETATYTPPVGTGNTSSGVTVNKPKTFADAKKSALARNFE